MKPISVNLKPVASRHQDPQERIIEYSGAGKGGLISIRIDGSNNLVVECYRHDVGVHVVTGQQPVSAVLFENNEEAQKAFADAIKSGRLTVLEGHENSAADVMFMGYETNGKAMFKHINTRRYVP